MFSRKRNEALIFLAFLLLPFLCQGIEGDQIIDPKAPVEAEATDSKMEGLFQDDGASMGMMVTVLGFVVILGSIGLAGWFLVKRGLLRKPFKTKDGKLKIAETRMLGNRQFIMVVEYEEQKILLGVGPGKIDYLTNLHSFRPDNFGQMEGMGSGKSGGDA